jgi:hypothetical protein
MSKSAGPDRHDNAQGDDVVAPSSLFQEFRNLGLLLNLVTALNHPDDHSTLTLVHDTSSPKLDKKSTVMHAMASILVLEHEILACMAWKDKHLVIAEDRNDDGEDYLVDLPAGKVNLATIKNPDAADITNAQYGSCSETSAGKDLWPLMLTDKFDVALGFLTK